jgi:hypothetical protein
MQRSKRQTVSTVFPCRKAVEKASALLAFNTRLKPGVNEKSPLTLGFDSREDSKFHRVVAQVINQTQLHFAMEFEI